MAGGNLWTIADLCAYLKIPTATARKWIRLRKLPTIRCGRLLRFRPAAIEAWLDDHTTASRERRGAR